MEMMHPADLIPYARNAKKHDAGQVSQIAASIREFGFNAPVLIDQDKGIIAGHGRVMAAIKLGLESVPTICLSHLSEVQRRAYILADNRLAETGGGWDADMLKVEYEALKEADFDHLLTGLDDDFIAEHFGDDEEDGEEDEGDGDEDEDEEFTEEQEKKVNIYTYDENVVFPSSHFLGIPELRGDMLFDQIPDDTWAGQVGCANEFTDLFLTIHGANAATKGMRYIKAFYCDDYRFESIWDDAVASIDKFKEQNVLACYEPDFSMWWAMPMAVQMWNLYRSRWCARFWQEAGIRVIPSLKWGPTEFSWEACASGYPKAIPLASFQCRTLNKDTREHIAHDLKGLKYICDKVDIEQLMLYGGAENPEILEIAQKLIPHTKMVPICSWTEKRAQVRTDRKQKPLRDNRSVRS